MIDDQCYQQAVNKESNVGPWMRRMMQ